MSQYIFIVLAGNGATRENAVEEVFATYILAEKYVLDVVFTKSRYARDRYKHLSEDEKKTAARFLILSKMLHGV